MKGYKYIMNWPDFQNTGKFFPEPELKEGSSGKFLTAGWFFPVSTGMPVAGFFYGPQPDDCPFPFASAVILL
jgi:hypothetical protein